MESVRKERNVLDMEPVSNQERNIDPAQPTIHALKVNSVNKEDVRLSVPISILRATVHLAKCVKMVIAIQPGVFVQAPIPMVFAPTETTSASMVGVKKILILAILLAVEVKFAGTMFVKMRIRLKPLYSSASEEMIVPLARSVSRASVFQRSSWDKMMPVSISQD